MSKNQQIFSTVCADNRLKLSLQGVDMPTMGENDILVRVDATPLNPSDISALLVGSDVQTARSESETLTIADIPEKFMAIVAQRIGKSLSAGAEAAGEVVDAGNSDLAQSLIGKTVAFAAGKNYTNYRCVRAKEVMPMMDGVSAREAASAYVNPLTSSGFVETMKAEGHKAMINTAAASNLGQMLNRICMADGIDLVNVVRKPEQEQILRDLGAKYIVNSSDEKFLGHLTEAVAETGATIAFDAIGGGDMGDKLIRAMEKAAARGKEIYDFYGSRVYKKLYFYGSLDRGKSTLSRMYGFDWGVEGWFLPNFLAKTDPATIAKIRQRIAEEIPTTFATHYSHEISLAQVIDPATIKQYAKQATGEKYLVCPSR